MERWLLKAYSKICLSCPASLACVAGVAYYYQHHDGTIVSALVKLPPKEEMPQVLSAKPVNFIVTKDCPGLRRKMAKQEASRQLRLKKEAQTRGHAYASTKRGDH